MESKNEEIKKADSHAAKQSPREVTLTEHSNKSSESTGSKQRSPLLFLTRRMKSKKKRESGFSDGDYETTIEEEGPDPSAEADIVKSDECTKVAKGKLKKGSKSISKVFKYRPKIRKSISAPADVRREMDNTGEMTTVIDDSESISSYTTPYEVSSSGYNTPLQLESSAETPETSQSLTESLVDEGELSVVEKTPKVNINPYRASFPADSSRLYCQVYMIGPTLRRVAIDPCMLPGLLETQVSSALQIPNTEALAKTMEALQVLHEAPVDSRISDVKHETVERDHFKSNQGEEEGEAAPLASSESSLSSKLEDVSSSEKKSTSLAALVHGQDVSTVPDTQSFGQDQVAFGQRSNQDPSPSPSTLLQSSITFRGSNTTGAKPKSSSLPDRPTTEEIRFYFTEYNNGHTLPDSDKQEGFIRSLPSDTNRMDNSSNTETNGYLKNEHLYKVLVIGELGTGKTSIIKRYVHQFFSQHYRATIGVDFALKVVHWDQNTVIRLQLWDIAGQERFGNMTRVYYKEAVGAFVVFDVTRSSTFESVAKWKQDLDAKVQLPDGSPLPCVLLANKCDQPKEGVAATPAKLDEYCKEKGFAGWFETSAKDNINIDEAAKFLVGKILENDKWSTSMKSEDGDKFDLNKQNSRDKKKGCC